MATYPVRKGLLDALIQQESGGDNNAISNKGAMGLAQIMPATAQNPGYGVMPLQDNSPEEQRRFANDYLGAMLNKFDGNEPMALAAYNAGPGAVEKAGGVPNIPETKNYVDKISHAINPIKEASANETPYALPDGKLNYTDWKAQQAQQEQPPLPNGKLNYADWKAQQAKLPFDSINAPYDALEILDAPRKVAKNVLTGMGAGVLGGAKELYSLATGGTPQDARNQMADIQERGIYQSPESKVGKLAIDAFNSPKNPLTLPGQAIAALTDSVSVNNPRIGAAIEGLAGISPLLMGGALLKKAPVVKPVVDPIIKASQNNGSWIEQPKINNQSVNAASTPVADQAIQANIAPEAQQLIAQHESAGTLNEKAAQNHITSQSLPVPITLTAPQAMGDLQGISDTWNMRSKIPEYMDRFSEQNQALADNFDALHELAAPDLYGVNHVDNGRALIDAYKADHKAADLATSEKYKVLESMNGGQFPIDGKSMAKNAFDGLVKDDAMGFLPNPINRLLSEYASGKPMSFQNFVTFRKILANEARRADGTIGQSRDGNAIHAIKLVRNALEDMPMDEALSGLRSSADAAAKSARDHFETINNDPAYSAAINDKVAPDDFINRFVIRGKAADVTQMRKTLGNAPLIDQTIASSVIQHLKDKARIMDNGSGDFAQKTYNNALKAINPKLIDLVTPDIAEHLRNLGETARIVKERKSAGYQNHSNTFAAGMANNVRGAFTRVVDAKTLGGASLVNDFIDKRKLTAEAKKNLAPAAGISIVDFPIQGVKP